MPYNPNPRTYIDKNGYRKFLDSRRFVHRWVMEKKLGRKLRLGEVVHHINGDKLDNDPVNLMVFGSQEEHHMCHTIHKQITGKWVG
jgi:hypothetical protein